MKPSESQQKQYQEDVAKFHRYANQPRKTIRRVRFKNWIDLMEGRK